MLKTETKEIGDHSVAVTQFAGRRNMSILIDLSTVVGPTIAATVGSTSLENFADAEIDIEKIAMTLVKSMDKAKVTKLIDDLLSSTHVNDRQIDEAEFNRLFAGTGLWTLPKILAFVVEVNFGNFSELAGSVSAVSGHKATGGSSDA